MFECSYVILCIQEHLQDAIVSVLVCVCQLWEGTHMPFETPYVHTLHTGQVHQAQSQAMATACRNG